MPRHLPPNPARRTCPLHGLTISSELTWIDFDDVDGFGVSIPVLCAEWMGLPSTPALTLVLLDEQWVALVEHEHSQEHHAVHVHAGAGRTPPSRGSP